MNPIQGFTASAPYDPVTGSRACSSPHGARCSFRLVRRRLGRNTRADAERTIDIGALAARFEAVIRRGAAELSQSVMCARYHS